MLADDDNRVTRRHASAAPKAPNAEFQHNDDGQNKLQDQLAVRGSELIDGAEE